MSLSPMSYRDRSYIVEDIILNLVNYGELNQTALVSFCGLNVKKHRCLLDELKVNNLIHKTVSSVGKRIIVIYKATQKGIEFCRSILEPYEKMFPRRKEPAVVINNYNKEEERLDKKTTQSGRKMPSAPKESNCTKSSLTVTLMRQVLIHHRNHRYIVM